MPLKVLLGLSKKIGLPDYGSLGASCSIECELDSALLHQDLDGFQQQVRRAYTAAWQAVNDQLARHQATPSGANGDCATDAPAEQTGTNGETGNGRRGNGTRNGSRQGSHGISQKQIDYAHQLAGQIRGLGVRRLAGLCDQMFGKPLEEISSLNASSLIDVLKDIKAGKIDVDQALRGAAA